MNVGTNGGVAYTRPDLVPARSDTTLVTSYAYADQPIRTLEAIGAVSLTVDPQGRLCANGIRLNANSGGVSYTEMIDRFYTAVAAETINGRNQVVWRLPGGALDVWEMDAGWIATRGTGRQETGSAAHVATETSFSMDFDGNAMVGSARLIEATGSVSLTVDAAGMLCANGVRITTGGTSVSFASMVSQGFTAAAADTIGGQNLVAWRLSDGAMHFWRLDASWRAIGGFDRQVPRTPEHDASEAAFGVDFDGNGSQGIGPSWSGLPRGGVSYRDATDPRGTTARTLTDALGRTTATIANFTGSAAAAQTDVTTAFSFDTAGRLASRTAVQPTGRVSQVTGYVYGVSPTGGSTIWSNDILAETRYPDPATNAASAAERDTYTSNALGERIGFTDRAGTTHAYVYDPAGRRTADTITTSGTGVDWQVGRIESRYDAMGRVTLVSSYGFSGNVVNQVERAYNGFGQLSGEWQAHTGLVNRTTTSPVQYAYSEGVGGNHSRLTRITYPDSYAVNYTYTGIDSAVNRPTSLAATRPNSTTAATLEAFKYLGAGTVIERSRPEVNMTLSMVNLSGTAGAVGDKYTGLDRFGRVVDQRWTQGTTPTSAVVDRSAYTYDRNSSRLTRSSALATAFSERYSYDALNQLSSYTRGSGTTPTGQWSFDALGNWTSLTTNGVAQTRTANAQNEVTQVGTATLTYSRTGNLAKDEQGRTLVYDGWNRLVSVRNTAGTEIARYEYDGLNRRIVEQVGSPAAPDASKAFVRDVYYSQDWQVIEERVRNSLGMIPGSASTRFIWSPVYVDALIARDARSGAATTARPAAGSTDGMDQRVYALQDANWNTTAIVSAGGVTGVAANTVFHRFVYTPYGEWQILTSAWTALAAGTTAATPWSHLFQGLEFTVMTGLSHARNRDYSASLGRFITLDPIGFNAGDNNWYRFVENGPTGKVDPSGLDRRITNAGVHLGIEFDLWDNEGNHVGVMWVDYGDRGWRRGNPSSSVSLSNSSGFTCSMSNSHRSYSSCGGLGQSGEFLIGIIKNERVADHAPNKNQGNYRRTLVAQDRQLLTYVAQSVGMTSNELLTAVANKQSRFGGHGRWFQYSVVFNNCRTFAHWTFYGSW